VSVHVPTSSADKESRTLLWLKWVTLKASRGFALLVGSSFIIYVTLRSAPGDVAELILGLNGTEEMKAALRQDFGLDSGPIWGYLKWAWRALQGDLGSSISFMPGEPVATIAAPAFLVTLTIACTSLILSLCLAFLLTALLGAPRSKEALLLGPLRLLNAAPSFLISICLMKVINDFILWQLSGGGQIAPSWYPLPVGSEPSLAPFGFAILAISLGDGLFTDTFNAVRAELTRLNQSLFINAVRARGAHTWPHLLKNMIIPTLSIFTARLPLVLGAVVIVEYIFTLEGSGYVLLQAAQSRDVPVVVGVSILFIVAVIVMNLILDLVKSLVDPREIAKGE
jgi:peptide/nickel transport system permease protein